MKHTLKVTATLVLFFFIAQLVGLLIVNSYIDHKKTIEAKEIVMKPLPYGFERPQVKNQSTSFIFIMASILVGTGLLLLIAKADIPIIWKILFFAAVSVALSVAFAAFLNVYVAGILAIFISFLRLYKPNVLINNLSEIFIYGGLAAMVVNIFNLFAIFMLLLLISAYDYISVFKTKHMIRLAHFQSKSRVFAGLSVPYSKHGFSAKVALPKSLKAVKTKVAVLGGGDIGFPLIFAGVVMKGLMLKETVLVGFLKAMVIPVFVSLSLLLLLVKGQENKFYPAMPVLSLGCFIGYLVVLIL